MNARLAALITALETLVVVGIGVGIFFAPLSLVWALDDQFSTDLLTYWRASADFWLLGHGVPISVSLDYETAAALGLAGGQSNFVLSAAPLGTGLLTLWWGFRMGRRDLILDYPLVVWLVGVVTLAGLSYGIHVSAAHSMATTDLVQATIQPSLFLAAGLIVASWTTKWSQGRQWMQSVLSEGAWNVLATGARAGIAAAFGLIGIASVYFALLLIASYATVVGLFESLGPSVMGLIVLFIGQLALIPNFVIWIASWLVGPGFSLGSAAHFSPLGTDIQAVPALPILGSLPTNVDSIGFSLIALPVLVAVVATMLAKRAQPSAPSRGALNSIVTVVSTAVVSTVIAVVVLSVPAVLSSGAFGPGRFIDVGIIGSDFATWWAIEVLAGSILGALAFDVWRWVRLQDQAYSAASSR